MADDKTKAGQETGQQSDTVSKKDFEELLAKFEMVQKAQQGSDRKVQELTDALKAKEDEIKAAEDKAKTANLDKVDQVNAKLEEMKAAMEKANRDAERKDFLAKGYKLATELNVSPSLVDHYGGEQSGLEEFLKNVKSDYEAKLTKELNEKLAGGYKPNNGDSGNDGTGNWNSLKHTAEENKAHWKQYYKEFNEVKAPA